MHSLALLFASIEICLAYLVIFMVLFAAIFSASVNDDENNLAKVLAGFCLVGATIITCVFLAIALW